MRIEELIEELQQLAAAHPGLKVKFRTNASTLTSIDTAEYAKDTFSEWAEIS